MGGSKGDGAAKHFCRAVKLKPFVWGNGERRALKAKGPQKPGEPVLRVDEVDNQRDLCKSTSAAATTACAITSLKVRAAKA